MTTSGKMKWSIVTSVVAILSLGATAHAVPVVPNFTQVPNDDSHGDDQQNH